MGKEDLVTKNQLYWKTPPNTIFFDRNEISDFNEEEDIYFTILFD